MVEVPVIDPLAVAPTIISPATSPGVQDTAGVTTTAREERAATPTPPTWAVTLRDSGTVVVRTTTGTGAITGNTFPIATAWDGKTDGGAVVADGTYSVTATFADQYGNTGTTPAVAVTVDDTVPTAGPLTNPYPVIAPGTASTVPTTTNLTDKVGDANLAGWTVTVRNSSNVAVRTFTGTGTAVNVTWDGTDGSAARVPDGAYTLTPAVRDTAGNTTTPAGQTVVVLTQPRSSTAAPRAAC